MDNDKKRIRDEKIKEHESKLEEKLSKIQPTRERSINK